MIRVLHVIECKCACVCLSIVCDPHTCTWFRMLLFDWVVVCLCFQIVAMTMGLPTPSPKRQLPAENYNIYIYFLGTPAGARDSCKHAPCGSPCNPIHGCAALLATPTFPKRHTLWARSVKIQLYGRCRAQLQCIMMYCPSAHNCQVVLRRRKRKNMGGGPSCVHTGSGRPNSKDRKAGSKHQAGARPRKFEHQLHPSTLARKPP